MALLRNGLAIALVSFLPAGSIAATPLGSAFTYDGHLKQQGGGPPNAPADFEFSLWDAEAGGNQVAQTQAFNNVPVTDGHFSVQLDFGVDAFDGQNRWLEIAVRRPAGIGNLSPASQHDRLSGTSCSC